MRKVVPSTLARAAACGWLLAASSLLSVPAGFAGDTSTVGGDWMPFGGLAEGCNGEVLAGVALPDGRIAVGGAFTACGTAAARGVAVFDPATDRWSTLGSGVRGTVWSLHLHQGVLHAGGSITRAGDVVTRGIARWTGTAWQALGSGINGTTRAMASGPDGALYVAGNFPDAGGVAASNVARWDGAGWQALGAASAQGVDGGATALAFGADGALYVGGSFINAGGVLANRIARWNGSAWSALGSAGAVGVGGSVFALLADGPDLVAGGVMTSAGGTPVRFIARWNGSMWAPIGSGAAPGFANVVRALALHQGRLYAGGDFLQADGRVVNHVARLVDGQWQGLADAGTTGVGRSGVRALASHPAGLLVAGNFFDAGNAPRTRVAWWTGDDFLRLGSSVDERGFNGTVLAMVEYGGELIVAGDFTRIGEIGFNHIARWDGSTFRPFATAAGTGADGQVRALAVWQGQLIAAGDFTRIGGVPAQRIARWDGSTWRRLGSQAAADLDNSARALAVDGSWLYVGGTFGNAGGSPVGRVARWDGAAWSALGSGAANGVGFADPSEFAVVFAMQVLESTLHVGGQFDRAGGEVATNVATWNGGSWSTTGPAGSEGVGGLVLAMAGLQRQVVVAGNFVEVAGGSVTAYSLARYDPAVSAWSAYPPGAGNDIDATPRALLRIDDAMVVGGDFERAGTLATSGVARWDGTRWADFGPRTPASGIRGSVRAIARYGGDLYFGGAFGETATGVLSAGLVRFAVDERFSDGFE